jgi:hypothetical protein
LSTHDRELIDRYLADQLSGDELTAVEARIVMDPAFRREVDLTEGLRTGLARLDRSGDIDPLINDPIDGRPVSGKPGRVPSFLSRPAYAMAATVAVLGLGLLSLLMFGQLQHERALSTTIHQLPRVASPTGRSEPLSFASLRSGAGAVSIRPPDSPVQYDLSFDVGAQPAAAYSIRISRVEADTRIVVLEIPRVATDDDGLVSMSAHSALLQPGTYSIRLEPARDVAMSATAPVVSPITYSLVVTE